MTTPDPWDDDRLAAAFAARAASVAVPADLVTDATAAMRRRSTSGSTWWRALPIAAAAAVVVSIVGLSLAMSWRTGSPRVSTAPSNPAQETAAAPTASPQSSDPLAGRPEPAFPASVQGLPVISVGEAEMIRDAGVDDRELAVHGWYSTGPMGVCSLPSRPQLSPLEPGCRTERNWLLQDPEVLVIKQGNVVRADDPIGPAVHMHLMYGGQSLSGIDPAWIDREAPPFPMVVLGHFDDRMAASCREEDRPICEDRFVVDRIASFLGVSLPIETDPRDDEVRTDPKEIVDILSSQFPDSELLSLEPISGMGLEGLDQTLPSVIEQFKDVSRVWLLRVLEGAHATTIYVTDDSHEAFRLTDSGEVVPLPTDIPTAPALQNGKLAVVGVDGGPGELFCNKTFPVSGLTAPTGAEDRVGPEFDVLRATVADPGLEYGAADGNTFSWREAGRTDDTVVFLAEKPTNGDERYWLELSVRRDSTGWRFIGGGDCFPRAILPDGVGLATWVLDPAYPNPSAQDTTVHLLVTESTCAGGQPADDRLAPAYVVADPYRIEITIGVATRPGAQRCPLSPPTAVEIDLGSPIDDRPLLDPNAPPPPGSSG